MAAETESNQLLSGDETKEQPSDCQIKCANCDGIFSPDRFEEHVCEYDESKKRIESAASLLEGHPCFRQIEENMKQWKRLKGTGGSGGRKTTGGNGAGGKDDKSRKQRPAGKDILREMHRCAHCERKFVHESGLVKHMNGSHPDKVAAVTKDEVKKEPVEKNTKVEPFKVCLKCLKCGLIFGSVEQIMEHLEMVDWEKELERGDGDYMEDGMMRIRKAIKVVILTTVYQCEFCDKHFSDLPALYQHESLHDPACGYECTLCEIKVPTVKDSIYHRLNECVFREAWNEEFQNISKYFACNVCDEHFQSLVELYEHRYSNYHLFPRQSRLDEHESSEPLKIACEVCGTTFDNADAVLSHHTELHAPKKSTTLGIRRRPAAEKSNCSPTTATTTTSPSSSSARPYLCDVCGKTYTQSSHLWQHLRFHNGIRPFTCPEVGCNRSFTIRPDLKDHIRKCHTGERPYHCDLCDKRFLTGSVYYQHRLIHRGERRYGCDDCGKRFYRADALKNHQRIHSGEKPYACPHCIKQFRQRGDREKHIRVKHSNEGTTTTTAIIAPYEGTPLTSRGSSSSRQSKRGPGQRRSGPKKHSQLGGAAFQSGSQLPPVVEQVIYAAGVPLPASLFQPILNDIDML